MQFLNDLQKKTGALLAENASALLTAGGVVGTVATAVLTGRATFKAADLIRTEQRQILFELQREADTSLNRLPEDIEVTTKGKLKIVWPLYIPPVLTGVVTIGSIVMANRMSAQKVAALAAAYGISERQLREYKEKVAEKLTPAKEQKIQAELAQERVDRTPGHTQIIVMDGEVLCFDQPTGRYFRCTMERINRAVNAVNAEILAHGAASASFFYDELELDPTTWTQEVGWANTGELVELNITTVMTPEEKPCIAIDFKHLPRADYLHDYS